MGSLGVLVGIETDADAAAAAEVGGEVAMHIAAAAPLFLNPADVPEDVL